MSRSPRPPKGSTLDLAIRAKKKLKQPTASSSGITFYSNPHQQYVMHTDYGMTADRNSSSTHNIAVETSRPAKRPKSDFSIAEEHFSEAETHVPPKRNQGASVAMHAFNNHLDTLLHCILQHERPPDDMSKCLCGAAAAFQCPDCRNRLFWCQKCILAVHRHLPYHWINEWNGKFFTRRNLADLGLALTMEHDNDICPHFPPNQKPKKITVVDTSGIHQDIPLYYCHCASRPPEIHQLMNARLFPATVEDSSRIKTAFSFSVLSDFHIDNLTSKKSAYDYCEALRRRTNHAFPSSVPNKYRSFLLVSRVWRHLDTLKRSGQAHGIDKILTHRVPGSMAVRCVACPEDGLNLPPGWQDTPPTLRHIFTKYLSADGNHGNQKKIKNDDPDDIALGNGRAYFPQEDIFQMYLHRINETQEKSTCANLKAINMQNKAKFRNVEITGVVAIVCARHGLFQPGAVVDLQKGERYANVDYALAQALRESHTLPWLTVTYDVACQWSLNLVRRFEKHFPESAEMAKRIVPYVAKMHAQGHKEDCRYRYSLNYSDGVGRTSGELIETVWHEHNQAGGSTKEMNSGHRHDTLDDLFGDWNWTKVQEMSYSLYRSLTNARAMRVQSQSALDAIDVTREQVKKWDRLSTKPILKDGEWHSVYRATTVKAPTQARVYQQLFREESNMEVSNVGEAHFLNNGLRLQAAQRRLREQISDAGDVRSQDVAESLTKAQGKLRGEIDTWRKFQSSHFPALGNIVSEYHFQNQNQNPEDEILYLPSDFPRSRRHELGLEDSAIKERQLREGEANDALEKVRTAIKQFGINVSFKMKEIRGQRDNTRAQKVLQDNVAARNKHVQKYRLTREALIRLGMAEDDPTYRLLRDEDLWMKNILTAHELGDGTRDEPWIWRMGSLTGNSAEERAEWEQEVDRVRWFRARANRDRWREEVEILEEEFRRTYRSFVRMAAVWTQLAIDHAQLQSPIGFREYAYKQAAMYEQLAAECRDYSVKANVIVQ